MGFYLPWRGIWLRLAYPATSWENPFAVNDGRACPARPSGSPSCGRAAATLASAASLAANGGPQQRPAEGRPLAPARCLRVSARPPLAAETDGRPLADRMIVSVQVLVSCQCQDTLGLTLTLGVLKG